MRNMLDISKIFTMSQIPKSLLKDPEEMFNSGIICMEACMLTSLGRYIRDHDGDLKEYEDILNHFVSDGIIYEEAKEGYMAIAKSNWEEI